ncbi:hypothetical protein FB45DRAFT_922397 [Roridomyces roridus]|uniref:Uncharacterized protein n=1 Tax=Roridomyces roridus TaxID=1738132 RepID=A0AAD7BN24_9AGAR|nr:hypothetical protein FB45DRAFT_922397 [Roridomyces roridus]
MLAATRPRPSAVYHPVPVPYYKRQRTASGSSSLAESPQGVPPAASFYTPRGPSTAASSIYTLSCSSPTASVSSFNSMKEVPKKSAPPLTPSWLTRSPRLAPSSDINTIPAAHTSPDETPMDVPEAELRRRQLDKATRLLGETVPIELVFHPQGHRPLKSLLDHSIDEKRPRDMTVPPPRRPRKLTRRASLTLSVITSKFLHGRHSRDSSEDSSFSSPSSPPALHMPHQHPDVAPISPITFAFPRLPTPARAEPPKEEVPVIDIDIGSTASCGYESDSSEEEQEDKEDSTTPVRRSHTHSFSDVLPRTMPMPPSPPHGHAHSHSEDLYGIRPDTPFADYHPETPFLADPSMTGPLGPVVRKERRGEQGWSGEWNQSDMRHVLHKLRTLKS